MPQTRKHLLNYKHPCRYRLVTCNTYILCIHGGQKAKDTILYIANSPKSYLITERPANEL